MKKNPFAPVLSLFPSTLAVATLMMGCKGTTDGRVKEFKEFSESARQSVQIKLPNLQRALAAAKLPQVRISAVKYSLATDTYTEEQRTHLAISLGALSREQCEVARKVYADGWKANLSGVDCSTADGQKKFILDDFLTPVMQATVRHTFIPEKSESTRALTSEERKQYGISSGGEAMIVKTAETNCWSTAYEILRRAGGANPVYTVHNLLPEEVDVRLTSAELTKPLMNKVSAAGLKSGLAATGILFGDFVIVRDRKKAMEIGTKSDIQHVTVMIDEGLVFERVGTDQIFPMRIASIEDVISEYSSAEFEVRRLLKDFPNPQAENFSRYVKESSEGMVYEVTIELKDVALSKAGTGRYSLPQSAYSPPKPAQ
jgi:hypothetical protein